MQELIVKNWKVFCSPSGLSGYWVTGEEIGRHLGYADIPWFKLRLLREKNRLICQKYGGLQITYRVGRDESDRHMCLGLKIGT